MTNVANGQIGVERIRKSIDGIVAKFNKLAGMTACGADPTLVNQHVSIMVDELNGAAHQLMRFAGKGEWVSTSHGFVQNYVEDRGFGFVEVPGLDKNVFFHLSSVRPMTEWLTRSVVGMEAVVKWREKPNGELVAIETRILT